jgi:Protein of unknown function (DUF3035)
MMDNEAALKRQGLSLLAVASFCSMLLLGGCTSLRQMVGLDRTGPDEFAVESRAPLTIPPEFELRPPQLGAARPQEVSAAERARKAIDTAGPGEPGKQASAGLRAPEGGLRRGEARDAGQDQGDQGLSNKLLGYGGDQGGAGVEKRETTTLKGVY